MGSAKGKILSMLEDGKISVDEAVRLLEAVSMTPPWADFDKENAQEQFRRAKSKADDLARTVKCKLTDTWVAVEPKVKHATRCAIAGTLDVVEKMSCSLKESLDRMAEEAEAAAAAVAEEAAKCAEECCEEASGTPEVNEDDKPVEN